LIAAVASAVAIVARNSIAARIAESQRVAREIRTLCDRMEREKERHSDGRIKFRESPIIPCAWANARQIVIERVKIAWREDANARERCADLDE